MYNERHNNPHRKIIEERARHLSSFCASDRFQIKYKHMPIMQENQKQQKVADINRVQETL